jgi:Uri superfamily endonuclease
VLNPLWCNPTKSGVSNIKGTYLLIIELMESREMKIGKLGVFSFPSGYYTYTGSGMSGIYQRINRHLEGKKKLRWHIDYFLGYGKIKEVVILESKTKNECEVNLKIASVFGGMIIAPGFGAGDCRQNCGSHLFSIQKDRFQNHIEKQLSQVLSDGLLLKICTI